MTARRAAVVLAVALAAATAMVCVRPQRFVVDGFSMAPSLMPGDVVTTEWLPMIDPWRVPERFERWIVTAPEGGAAVKRLVGLPGERVAIHDGDLVVDDAVVVKPPHVLLPMAVATRTPLEVDQRRAELPPTEVLDDATFATEVNRPLEVVHDVGLAVVVETGPAPARIRAVVGDRRMTWRLPVRATVWIVCGRLDRHLVAVVWRARDAHAGDTRHALPSRGPAAWTIAEPWHADAGGVSVEVEPPAQIAGAIPWRDVHLRPGSVEASWHVTAGRYLLLGDFPSGSVDSRTWGPLTRPALRHPLRP